MNRENDKENNIFLQKLENQKIEFGIKNEAQRWLNEYIDAPTFKFNNKEFKNCVHIL